MPNNSEIENLKLQLSMWKIFALYLFITKMFLAVALVLNITDPF